MLCFVHTQAKLSIYKHVSYTGQNRCYSRFWFIKNIFYTGISYTRQNGHYRKHWCVKWPAYETASFMFRIPEISHIPSLKGCFRKLQITKQPLYETTIFMFCMTDIRYYCIMCPFKNRLFRCRANCPVFELGMLYVLMTWKLIEFNKYIIYNM